MKIQTFNLTLIINILNIGMYVHPSFAEDTKMTLDTVVVTTDEQAQDGPKGELIAQESSVGKIDVPIKDQPRSISVITPQRLADMGVDSIQDALLYSSGVHSGAYGDDTRGDWSIIRGTDPTLFVDGLKASGFSYYNNPRPNAYSINRVEILKGPASVEYGQGTIGGIVNLKSKLPQAKSYREITTEYGSFNHKLIGSDMTGKIDKDGEWLYRFVGIVQDADHQTDFVENNQLALSPSITWNATDKTSFTALFNFQDNHSGTGTQFLPHAGTIFPAPNGSIRHSIFLSEPDWDKYDTKQHALTLMAEHRMNDNWRLNATARYLDGNSDYWTMYPAFPPTINPDGRTINRVAYVKEAQLKTLTSDVNLKGDFATGALKHKATLGLDFQHAKMEESMFYGASGSIDLYNPVYGNIPVVTLTDLPYNIANQHGIYVNDHITLLNDWIVTLGLRSDWATSKTQGSTSQNDVALTKNIGLMYKFDNDISPYVSYAESFEPVIGTNVSGDSFDPKKGKQYEAGIKYQPPHTHSLFTAVVFDITEQNRLTNDPLNPLNSLQNGEVNIKGLELEAQFKVHDFDILTNFTHLKSEITKSNNGDQGFNLSDVPDNMASAWVTYRPSQFWKGFKMGGGVRYIGASWDGSDSFQRNAYTLADAMIGYELKEDWDLTLNVHNLTNEQYLTSCLSRGDCFLGEERTITANLTKRF